MNVVAIVLDTFRHDIIGPNAKLGFVKTPNLDALAERSIVFENAFGECQPTLQVRRSFFTGRRSFPFAYNYDRRGHWHHAPGWHKIPPHQDTLAEILSARGYCTGLVADVYHMFKPTMNYWRGFTNYEFLRGQESDNWRGGTPAMVAEPMARHTRDPENTRRHGTLYQYLLNQRFRCGEDDYQCARVFRAAADWIDDNAACAPFLLWVEAFDPHEPWDPPKRYADAYCPDYDGLDFIMPGALGPNPTEAEIERTRALYFGEVTFVDHWVGHLMNKLDERKLLDDTAVLVLSDHGTQVWDQGSFGKGDRHLQRFNTGIVWQMAIPGMDAQTVPAYVQTHDVMPTILDLLQVPYSRMDGASTLPLVRGAVDQLRDPIVTAWAKFSNGNASAYCAVRNADWCYITPVHHEPEAEQLFHLGDDPEETRNVLTDHPDVAANLKPHVEALVGQPLPAKLNEVCDPSPSPMGIHLDTRHRTRMN